MLSDLLSNLSPSEQTDLQLMLQGYGHCEMCWHGLTKGIVCDSCSEEAHQKENVRRYGNVPVMKEWNPLERKPDELLEHPYHAEMESYRSSKHAN